MIGFKKDGKIIVFKIVIRKDKDLVCYLVDLKW